MDWGDYDVDFIEYSSEIPEYPDKEELERAVPRTVTSKPDSSNNNYRVSVTNQPDDDDSYLSALFEQMDSEDDEVTEEMIRPPSNDTNEICYFCNGPTERLFTGQSRWCKKCKK